MRSHAVAPAAHARPPRRIGRLLARLAAATVLVAATTAGAAEPRPLHTRAAPLAEGMQPGATYERLRFRGMLEVPSQSLDGHRVSQLSALAWDEDEELLYALSDKGALFHFKPVFRDGVLVGLSWQRAVALLDDKGRPLKGRAADPEGLDALAARDGKRGNTELLVSFEREHRVARYRPDGRLIATLPLPGPLAAARAYRDDNKGLESVCASADLGVVVAPEAALRTEMRRLYTLEGAGWPYSPEGEARIVALECLPARQVIVLERDYGRLLWRSRVRLNRLTLGEPGKAPVVDPLVTLDTGRGFQIDNFEGLARHTGGRYFLVSDDNDLFIQRTLLLYVELTDAPANAVPAPAAPR